MGRREAASVQDPVGRASDARHSRVAADGKHLALGGAPFRVKGVTYGSFRPRLDGELYPEPTDVKKDLFAMAAAGVNVVRTYTVPPADMLDVASELGIRVLVGIDYRDWRYESVPGRAANRRVLDAGRREVEDALDRCAGRPEVLALAVGNEVPCDVVRTHGPARVEDVLSRLVEDVHDGDPGMLATYCNFPTTEFLSVEGQDLVSFNVFLEDPAAFRRYVRHLHVASGDRPLLISELGLTSDRACEQAQADALESQLRIVDECGIAGATVFSWTDEWGVNGEKVEGWRFGVTDEDRNPKPALDALRRWTASSVRDLRDEWPQVSVVVCVYNGDHLIEKCLRSLEAVDYPGLEVIVCDDGSDDGTLEIARRYPFEVLALERGGLSRARNAGIAAASGEIVAFLDADAYCHPEWPYHLALSLEDANVVATGGPNLPVGDASPTELAVAESPGSPVEVLVSDDRAEHVPGCNMAFSKAALAEVGGFDPLYRAAGDDVDACWKILDRGWEIGFSPAAQVRHHRRDSVRGYFKQQKGYGRAEVLLRPNHRRRFNGMGQARWTGVVYGGPRLLPHFLRPVVYHGWAGMAPYQPVVRNRSQLARDWGVALMPLFALAAATGTLLAAVSLWFTALAAVALATILAFAVSVAAGARVPKCISHRVRFRATVAWLHVAQPLVRSWGRIRTKAPEQTPRTWSWTGDRADWVRDLELCTGEHGLNARVVGPSSKWDMEVCRWGLVSTRIVCATLWTWWPSIRTRFRIRPLAACIAIALGVLALEAPVPATVGAVALGVGMSLEMLAVHRGVRLAIEQTTRDVSDV